MNSRSLGGGETMVWVGKDRIEWKKRGASGFRGGYRSCRAGIGAGTDYSVGGEDGYSGRAFDGRQRVAARDAGDSHLFVC
jgi:hypothetical protein